MWHGSSRGRLPAKPGKPTPIPFAHESSPVVKDTKAEPSSRNREQVADSNQVAATDGSVTAFTSVRDMRRCLTVPSARTAAFVVVSAASWMATPGARRSSKAHLVAGTDSQMAIQRRDQAPCASVGPDSVGDVWHRCPELEHTGLAVGRDELGSTG